MLGEAAWLLLGSCLAAVGCLWFVAEGELVTLASLLCCCACYLGLVPEFSGCLFIWFVGEGELIGLAVLVYSFFC